MVMGKINLKNLTGKIRDKKFRVKVEKFFESSLKKMGRMGGVDFFSSPAGKSHHHSYVGGLVQHTFSTVKIALALVDVLEKVYGWKNINKDYVLAGALLHDLYKPTTYIFRENGTIDFSSLGERLDHLSILVGEAYKNNFPTDFIHVLAASHGDSSPISPKTIEALIVHLADYVDSRLIGEIQKAAYYLTKKCVGETLPKISPKDALKIVYAKQVGGCEEVRKTFEKLKRKTG